MSKYFILSILGLLLFMVSCGSSQLTVSKTKYPEISKIKFKQDSIVQEGVFVGNRQSKKPLILYMSGSGTNPYYLEHKDTIYFLRSSGMIERSDKYNFIFVSNPGVPVMSDITKLDSTYSYHENGRTPKDYTLNNNMVYYVNIYSSLLDNLNKKGQLIKDALLFLNSNIIIKQLHYVLLKHR